MTPSIRVHLRWWAAISGKVLAKGSVADVPQHIGGNPPQSLGLLAYRWIAQAAFQGIVEGPIRPWYMTCLLRWHLSILRHGHRKQSSQAFARPPHRRIVGILDS
jgi:hypothetical protein